MPTTTNRPFFANFLAAFRAHSVLNKASSSTTASKAASQSSTTSAFASATTQLTSPASARAISTKPSSPSNAATTTTAAVQATGNAFAHSRQTSTSPHTHPSSVGRHPPSQSPTSPGRSGWPRRRGSDSSSDSAGFREVLGAEKWYIGGRTAAGEERFLRLGMVHRERSWERRSADQMSL